MPTLTKRKIEEALREKYCVCSSTPLPKMESVRGFLGRGNWLRQCTGCGRRRQTQQDRERELDRASRPLRDAVSSFMRERALGGSSHWDHRARCWHFEVYVPDAKKIVIEILEDGSEALIDTHRASTPRGLQRVLSSLYDKK